MYRYVPKTVSPETRKKMMEGNALRRRMSTLLPSCQTFLPRKYRSIYNKLGHFYDQLPKFSGRLQKRQISCFRDIFLNQKDLYLLSDSTRQQPARKYFAQQDQIIRRQIFANVLLVPPES